MALINCEECKKEVSDKAATCPNCGAPLLAVASKQSLWDSVSQSSGPKEVVVRGTDVGYEAQKATQGLMIMVMALFLHPVFSFVGFWLLGFVLCLGTLHDFVAPQLGMPNENLKDLPVWFFLLAAAVPTVLAVTLRKIVPKIMKWIFYIAIGGIALAFIGGIISAIIKS